MDPLTLTAQLNALLQAINLPFVLTSPVDLTPSLLITIFESITQVPIPIAHAIDQEDENRHIQTIKVFIGVVELDFLQSDIGLSSLDLRLLAAGAWDEVVFVAEALCWIGEELELIQPVPVVDQGRVQDQVKKQGSSPTLHPVSRVPTPSPSSLHFRRHQRPLQPLSSFRRTRRIAHYKQILRHHRPLHLLSDNFLIHWLVIIVRINIQISSRKNMSNRDLHIYHHLIPLPHLTYTHHLIGQYQHMIYPETTFRLVTKTVDGPATILR